MKVHDAIVGGTFVLLGIFVIIYSQTLAAPGHLAYGPGFFPLLVGLGLAGSGVLIVLTALPVLRSAPLAVRPDWARSPRAALRFWAVPAAVMFYVLAAPTLGFLATCVLILVTLMRVNGVPLSRALLVGVPAAVAINIFFASILHVPLHWGPLTPVSGWLIW